MGKGILLSVMASFLFGALYFLVAFLDPLSGEAVLGWRILLTFPMVSIFILISKSWHYVAELTARIRKNPLLIVPILFNAGMMGFQFWLFMWAPRHNKGLEVSLGYFLLPLSLVFIGRFIYGEKLSRCKLLAVICAFLGVANEFYHLGSFAWETAAVALGYPCYFYVRRQFGLNHIGGLWYDMLMLVPLSIWFIAQDVSVFVVFEQKPSLYGLVLLLGLVSTSSWICYILAMRYLPFTLFGLLSYVEPMLLFVVSLLLGEHIAAQELPSYILIFAAVLLLIFEGILYLSHKKIEPVR